MLERIALWWTFLKLRWGSPQLRRETAIELGQLGNPRAVDPLIAALDRDLDMRREIATALGRIGDARAANALLGLLLDKSASTRLAAVWALGQVGDTRAVEPLAAVLGSDVDQDVCQTAAESLVRLGDARGIGRGVPALIQRLRRDAQGKRFDFEKACAIVLKVGEPAVEPCIELLQHGDTDVQEVAIKTITELGDGRVDEPLGGMLRSGSVSVRLAAAEALAKRGSLRATAALTIALGDPDLELRRTAASLLSRSGPRAVEPLIAALSEGDAVARQEATKVLALLRDGRAVDPLMAATEDPDEEVRWAAANALMALGDRRAIESLVHLLLRGDMVPQGFMHPFISSLRRAIHHLAVEILPELTHLEYVVGRPTRGDIGHGFANEVENRIDCGEIRQLANQELSRRGIQP
jgi:HEAT repeat protein